MADLGVGGVLFEPLSHSASPVGFIDISSFSDVSQVEEKGENIKINKMNKKILTAFYLKTWTKKVCSCCT